MGNWQMAAKCLFSNSYEQAIAIGSPMPIRFERVKNPRRLNTKQANGSQMPIRKYVRIGNWQCQYDLRELKTIKAK